MASWNWRFFFTSPRLIVRLSLSELTFLWLKLYILQCTVCRTYTKHFWNECNTINSIMMMFHCLALGQVCLRNTQMTHYNTTWVSIVCRKFRDYITWKFNDSIIAAIQIRYWLFSPCSTTLLKNMIYSQTFVIIQ